MSASLLQPNLCVFIIQVSKDLADKSTIFSYFFCSLHEEAEVDTHEREQRQTVKDSVPQVSQPRSPSPPGEPGEPTQPSGEQTALPLESGLQEAKEQQEEAKDPTDTLLESLVISEEPACQAEQQLWAAVEETTAETGESTESPKQEQKKEEGIEGG